MSELDIKEIGSRLKQYRKLKGMTQAELGDKIGKTASTIQKYENGIIEPPINVLEQICDVLNVFIGMLIPSLSEEYTKSFHKVMKKTTMNEAKKLVYEDFTPEEIEEIESFKKYILSKRKDKQD